MSAPEHPHRSGLRRVTALRGWVMREIGAVTAMLVIAIGALTFFGVADEVTEGDTRVVDEMILYGLREPGDHNNPLGPHWLELAAADMTSFGSITGLAVIVLLVAGVFAAYRRGREALILLLAPGTGVLVSQVAKRVFGRERPPMGLHAVEVANPSFPSGHAMLSAVVYLTLAVLVARFTARRRVKTYVLTAGITITVLVGVTRVYLGVHWPSDVLAGWSLGAAWALAWWLAVWAWDRLHPRTPLAG